VRDRNLGGLTYTQSFDLAVTAAPVNQAPVVTWTLPNKVTAGTNYTGQITVTDPDGDPITFTSITNPTSAKVNPLMVDTQGKVLWAPATVDINATPYSFTYRISDGQGHTTDLTFPITVTLSPPHNNPPVITSKMPTSAVIGQELFFVPTGTDPDNDPLVWSLTGAPSNVGFDPTPA
jgi:large repetitive protein